MSDKKTRKTPERSADREEQVDLIEHHRSKHLQVFSDSRLMPFANLIAELEDFSETYPYKIIMTVMEEKIDIGCFVFHLEESIPEHRTKLEALLERFGLKATIRYIVS